MRCQKICITVSALITAVIMVLMTIVTTIIPTTMLRPNRMMFPSGLKEQRDPIELRSTRFLLTAKSAAITEDANKTLIQIFYYSDNNDD